MAVYCEYVNIDILSYQKSVEFALAEFIALHVIMEVPIMYLESLLDNPLKEIMHHHPHRVHRGRDIQFSDRSLFHKLARIIYKMLRAFYVSVIFYYVPFWVLFVNFTATMSDDGESHH